MPPLFSTGDCLYGAYLWHYDPVAAPSPWTGRWSCPRDDIGPYGPVAVPSVLADLDRPLELSNETLSPPRVPPRGATEHLDEETHFMQSFFRCFPLLARRYRFLLFTDLRLRIQGPSEAPLGLGGGCLSGWLPKTG